LIILLYPNFVNFNSDFQLDLVCIQSKNEGEIAMGWKIYYLGHLKELLEK